MRKIPKETVDRIRSLAKDLQTAVRGADCRLLAQTGMTWFSTLKLVPSEVEMWDSPKSPDVVPIDPADVPSIDELDVVVFDSEVNQLYNYGESARNVF